MPRARPSNMPPPAARDDDHAGDEFDRDDGEAGYGTRGPQGDRMKRLVLDLIGRWHWIALGLVLGTLGAFYYLAKAPKTYTATATLLVKERTATVIGRTDQVGEIDMRSIEAMNTVAERLKRFELLESVANRQDIRALPGIVPPKTRWLPDWLATWVGDPPPAADPPPTAAPPDPRSLAGMIGGWMTISVRKYTRLLDVSIEHQVPEVAKALADAVTQEYVAEVAGNRFAGRSSAIDLLKRESEDARTALQEATTAHASYSRALDTHKELEKIEAEVEQLARRYLPKHPKMIAASGQLEALQRRFIDEFEAARLSQADKEYWATASKEWESTAGDQTTRLKLARRLLLSRTSVLESEMLSQTQVFNSMLTRIQEGGIEQEAPEAELEISNLAQAPGIATRPKPASVFVKGGAGGLALGLAIAFLFVKLDNKFHTVAQVEQQTDLPVLAAIGDLQPKVLAAAARRQASRARKRAPQQPSPPPPPGQPASAAQQDWDKRIVFRDGLVTTSFAEMFRVLRASISLLGSEKQRKVTLFTSAIPGEGKTCVSVNFALAAAGQRRKTLLIDLDLRKAVVHKMFGLAADAGRFGITEVLAGHAELGDAAMPLPGVENIDLVLAGARAPNPGELLNTQRLEQVIAEARERYEVVVLDTAPLLAVPDTRVLAPFADNLCLVVRAEYVPQGAVRRTLELLDEAGTPPSGLVFNGFVERKRLIGYNYTYGYYKYGRYGQAYKYGHDHYGGYGDGD